MKDSLKQKESKPFNHKRIDGEGIEYCNPFRVRNVKKPIVSGNRMFNYWVEELKTFSDGNYCVRLDNKPTLPKTQRIEGQPPEFLTKSIYPKKLGNGTKIIAEMKEEDKEPIAYVKGNSLAGFFNPAFIDNILTLNPGATPYLYPCKGVPFLSFHRSGEVVGIIAPYKTDMVRIKRTFSARLKELRGRV